jgi:hypothetical protein
MLQGQQMKKRIRNKSRTTAKMAEMLESRILMTITVQFSTYNLGNSEEATTLAANGWVGVLITAVSDNGKPIGGFDLDTSNRGIYGNMVQAWTNSVSSPTGTVPTSATNTVVDIRDSFFSTFPGSGFSPILTAPLAEDNNGSSHAPATNQKITRDYTFAPLEDAGNINYGLGTRLRGAGAFTSNSSTTLKLAFVIVPAGTNVQVIGQFADSTPTGFNVNQTFLVPGVLKSQLFYNNSAYDGNDPAANAADDNAIAIDKQPLLAGQTATFANYSSYSKGINGIMVDITPPTGAISAADFTFNVGGASPSDVNPANWVTAPAPTAIVARPGAGVGGSTRVELIWADNAIQKQWLQVTVKANGTTGLTADTAFYFGNAIGETGDTPGNTNVTAVDEIGARFNAANLTAQSTATAIVNPFDFNRDKLVNAADEAAAGGNYTFFLNTLQLITAPASPLVVSALSTGTLGIPSIVRATTTTTSTVSSIPDLLLTTTSSTSSTYTSIVPAGNYSTGTLTTITSPVIQVPPTVKAPLTSRLVPVSAKAHRLVSGLKKFPSLIWRF